MDKSFHKKLLKPKQVIGISCDIQSDGSYIWRYCHVQKSSNEIKIFKLGTTHDLCELKKEKLSAVPFYLIIEGKGVINRGVSIVPGQSPIYQVIPNANPSDYCISEYYTSNDYCYVSVLRNEISNSILEQFKQQGFYVINRKAGSFHVNNLHEWFKGIPSELATSNIEYSYNSDLTPSISFRKIDRDSDNLYSIEEEQVPSAYLSAFVSAIEFFIDEDQNKDEFIEENYREYLSHRLFVTAGWSLLIFIFSILMINYVIFNYYTTVRNNIKSQVDGKNQYMLTLNKLNDDLKQKEQFIRNIGFSNKSRLSFYLDSIASTIPASVNLYYFTINPLGSKIKSGKEILFRKGIISINGQTGNSIILNDWISNLETFSWISKITVLGYNHEKSRTYGEFEIEIELKQ